MLALLTLLALVPPTAPAPAPKSFTVQVDAAHKDAVDVARLKAVGGEPVSWSDKAGKKHTGEGAALDKVLVALGFDPGAKGPDVKPAEKHRGLVAAVVVTARDGYQAVFSTAELLPAVGPTRAFLVWSEDGVALGDDVGPFRLIVPTDKEPARAIRQINRIEIQAIH